MLPNEAEWMNSKLAEFPVGDLDPIINLGSGSASYRTTKQPFVNQRIILPLEQRGVSVVHADLKSAPGVDVVGSVFEDAVLEQLKAFNPKAVLCQNMLEHVPDPGELAEVCSAVLPVGGLVFVSVPFRFPYHADPIDTGLRPSPVELEGIFAGFEMLAGEVVREAPLRPPMVKWDIRPWIKLGAGLALPYPSFSRQRSAWSRVRAWGRECSVTCAVLQKV